MSPKTGRIESYECSQCGSTSFEQAGVRQVRCAHCDSLFEVLGRDPVVTIQKGANVVFEKNARVEFFGDVEVQPGATVHVNGRVSFKDGRKEHAFRLKLIRAGQGPRVKP